MLRNKNRGSFPDPKRPYFPIPDAGLLGEQKLTKTRFGLLIQLVAAFGFNTFGGSTNGYGSNRDKVSGLGERDESVLFRRYVPDLALQLNSATFLWLTEQGIIIQGEMGKSKNGYNEVAVSSLRADAVEMVRALNGYETWHDQRTRYILAQKSSNAAEAVAEGIRQFGVASKLDARVMFADTWLDGFRAEAESCLHRAFEIFPEGFAEEPKISWP